MSDKDIQIQINEINRKLDLILEDRAVQKQNNDAVIDLGAAPGGWSWTDQPGAVPDADDTAGALLALHQLRDDGNEP